MNKPLIVLTSLAMSLGTAHAALVEFTIEGNPGLQGGPLENTDITATIIIDTDAAQKVETFQWSHAIYSVSVDTPTGNAFTAGPTTTDTFIQNGIAGRDRFEVSFSDSFSDPTVMALSFEAQSANAFQFFIDPDSPSGPLELLTDPGQTLADQDFFSFRMVVSYFGSYGTVLNQGNSDISARVLDMSASPVPILPAFPLMAGSIGAIGLMRRVKRS